MADKPDKKTFKKAQPELKVDETVEEKLARLEREMSVKVTNVGENLPSPVVQATGSEQQKAKVKSKGKALSAEEVATAATTQLSFMHNPKWNMTAFWFLVVFSVLLSNVPGINFLLTPVNQFVTMVHELGHTIVTFLTGGHATLTIVSDGQGHGGLTASRGGIEFLTVQAGYIGTTLFGCLLIYLGQYPRFSKFILSALGVAMIASSIFFIAPGMLNLLNILPALASLAWGLGLGGACIYLGRKLSPAWANLMVLFLAVQTALSSLSLVWFLVPHALGMAGHGFSDATIMAQVVPFTLPIFWAVLWMTISVAMLFLTLKYTYGAAFMKKRIDRKL